MQTEWKIPVEVEEAVGSYRVIASTKQAAEALVYRWPVQEGAKWLHAMQKCLDAMEGKVKDDDARKAFIAAAVDANVGLRPWQRAFPEGKRVGTRWSKPKKRS